MADNRPPGPGRTALTPSDQGAQYADLIQSKLSSRVLRYAYDGASGRGGMSSTSVLVCAPVCQQCALLC